jgi:hypothetical protein
MKKIIILPFISIIFSASHLVAQNIELSPDSLSTLLCKKWQMNYVMMDGMKIERGAGAPETNFEFKKDKTYSMTDNKKNSGKGTWTYDPKKKLVKLITNGKSYSSVIELTDAELVMFIDTREATPGEPPFKTYFKPR